MVANIFISDVIGQHTTLKSVREQYSLYDNPEKVTVHINSVGGDVFEGYAIHDFFRSLGKKITTIIEGKCYSIATIIALAGDERLMSENSKLMIHNPWAKPDSGDSKHFFKIANELKSTEEDMAKFYSKKISADVNAIEKLMEEETYMNQTEAKEWGFVTKESVQLKAVAQLKSNMKDENKKEAKTILGQLAKMLGMEFEKEPKAMIETTLEDGTPVKIDSEDGDIVGKSVMISVDGEMIPAPSGEHKLEDGRVIVVADGVISEIKEPADVEAKQDGEEMAKMKGKIEALEAENKTLKAEKETAIQAKAKELEDFKSESEKKFKIMGEKMTQLNALVIGDAPGQSKKTNISIQGAGHKFDNLIKK